MPLYVVNCCHDLLVTTNHAVTKRGGLSSGDPVTSIANTIYSLVLFTQHMLLSYLKLGHPKFVLALNEQLTMEQLLEDQDIAVYSDDVVLHTHRMMTHQWWNEHLSLALGFKTDPKKTEIGLSAEFLGCRYIEGQLVPKRDRVLAALCYKVGCRNAFEYYASASAILMDASSCTVYDKEWFSNLVERVRKCANEDGYTFPDFQWYEMIFSKLQQEGGQVTCCRCPAKVVAKTACGLKFCPLHAYQHQHCPVWLSLCGHNINSDQKCSLCDFPMMRNTDVNIAQLEKDFPFVVKNVRTTVTAGVAANLQPGFYRTVKGKRVKAKREPHGVVVDLQDGDHTLICVPTDWSRINFVSMMRNASLSTYIQGPPGCGKSYYIMNNIGPNDTLLVPTHALLDEYIKTGRFNHRGNGPVDPLGPNLGLLCSRDLKGRIYIDEGCFCNPLDVAKVLSISPVILIGDHNQLAPVGCDKPFYAIAHMKVLRLDSVYRYSQNIVNIIAPFYDFPIVSKATVQTTFELAPLDPDFDGVTLTPYHKDRTGNFMTIDSSQGSTYDRVQIYLPTPGSLTLPRAIVAITRARRHVRLVDPFQQFKALGFVLPEGIPVLDGTERVDGWCPEYHLSGLIGYVDVHSLPNGSKVLVRKGLEPPQNVDPIWFESQAISCLPKVAHNLGYWFSPDLQQFDKIVPELCPHWPVVTARNECTWPDRLVVSLCPLSKFSIPAVAAGYYVGPSLFLGKPGVVSYYLTEYRNNNPVTLPTSLYSTGRFEANNRKYLDDAEEMFAKAHYHAFVGEDSKSVVGGCHHITSQFLPDQLPMGSVVVIGVSSPGKSCKAKCSVFDIYLPLLEPFLNISGKSKVQNIIIDHKPYRLMVWKDATCYVQMEGSNALLAFLRTQSFPRGCTFHIDLDDVRTNATLSRSPNVYVGHYQMDAPVLITTDAFSNEKYRLVAWQKYTTGETVYRYDYTGEDNTFHNIVQLHKLSNCLPIQPMQARNYALVNFDG
uniref:Replicase polyprotein 1ab n=1 Tax=Crocidura shantungensis arterivirus 2 TaxID=3139508 RepID=A0AB38ZJX6_9NIDO